MANKSNIYAGVAGYGDRAEQKGLVGGAAAGGDGTTWDSLPLPAA